MLIKIEPTPTPAPSTATVIPSTTVAPAVPPTATLVLVASVAATPPARLEQNSSNVMMWAIGIIALAIFGAGVFARRGSKSDASKNG